MSTGSATPLDFSQYAAQAFEWVEAGHFDRAGLEFRRVARTRPADPQPRQAMLECARVLVQQGRHAAWPDLAAAERAAGLISFVVCSITPAKLARLEDDIRRCFREDEYELVHIADARGLSEAYLRGLKRARGDLIVFCHDDIRLCRADFAARLRGYFKRYDLFGVAGSTKVTGPAWHWAGPPHTHCWVLGPDATGAGIMGTLLGTANACVADAQALDGVFLAAHRHVVERVGFDPDTFAGFHFYDLDFSYRASQAGLNCAVACDLLLLHESGGKDSPAWRADAERFMRKFPQLRTTLPCADFATAACPLEPAEIEPVYQWIAGWMDPSAQ